MKKLNSSFIISFTQIMSSLLKSGLQIQEALTVYSNIDNSRTGIKFCNILLERVNNGLLFSKALDIFRNSFGNFYLDLLAIGENSGTVIEVFEKLSIYLQERKQIRQKITQALIYPAIVLITAIIVIFCIMFFVFPRIESIFEVFVEDSSKVMYKILNLKFGILFTTVITIILFGLIFIFFFMRIINETFKSYTDKLLFRIPLIGNFLRTLCTNDFSFAMRLLCSSKIPFVMALEQASTVTGNNFFKNEIINVRKEIINGSDIISAFKNHKIFPPYFVAWLAIAEATGNIDNVFNQIHEYYTNESKNIISSFVVSVEPIFILITGIIIFVMVGQFVLPIFSLLGEL